MRDAAEPLRPRLFAVLLLSSGDVSPRQRARDQQADRAGLELKRRVLNDLVALDPEPEDLEAALLAIVEEFGPPSGPTRAIALALLEEWQAATATPGWMAHVLAEAVRSPKAEGRRRGRQLPA
ncbi:MAG TPA: hypothetical protein VG013_37500 [Gemmataceae bacterium]|jgi:hypothetical protein|nr:hypothetical protein [Gemmataceae bacterium]